MNEWMSFVEMTENGRDKQRPDCCPSSDRLTVERSPLPFFHSSLHPLTPYPSFHPFFVIIIFLIMSPEGVDDRHCLKHESKIPGIRQLREPCRGVRDGTSRLDASHQGSIIPFRRHQNKTFVIFRLLCPLLSMTLVSRIPPWMDGWMGGCLGDDG